MVCKPEYCEMDVWKMIIASFKAAGSSTCGDGGDEGCVTVLGAVDQPGTTTSEYATLGTAGVGWTGAGADGAAVDGFYFTDAVPEGFSGTSVLALGSPLFDETAVEAATVYVTLASSDIGRWSPFSWYPHVSPSKWAAIVTNAKDVSAVSTLIDRGYGYVYVTSEEGFDTKSTLMTSVITELEGTRRLEGSARRLQASAPFWGCDDTLFECKPICMKTMGVTTTKVSDTLCSAAPLDQCACKCFHEAQWTCEGDSVVCKAKYWAGELETVGDKVCETRGAPKPASIAELLVDSACEPVTEMHGSAPLAQCNIAAVSPTVSPTVTPALSPSGPGCGLSPLTRTGSARRTPTDSRLLTRILILISR